VEAVDATGRPVDPASAAGAAAAAAESDLCWRWSRFAALGVDDLYDLLALRCRVFILEQGPYQDPDGLDRVAWHLLARDTHGAPVAGLRVVDPGAKYAEPSIGRVVVAPERRGAGLGHALMREALARCGAAWPARAIRISAQAHLQGYYRRHGFETVGPAYLEDGIPHVEMLRPGPA
jgi:ElaA protein